MRPVGGLREGGEDYEDGEEEEIVEDRAAQSSNRVRNENNL